jgi:hypothetical protein
MKQKKCFWAVAATMLLTAASFTSCSNQDNVVAPEQPADYSFDEGSLIKNGQCEVLTNVKNYFMQVGADGSATNGAIPATIKWDEETTKNHCVIVDIRSEAEARAAGNAAIQVQWWAGNAEVFASYDTQFFISFGEENALKDKDQIRVTMDIKADAPFKAGTGAHAAPGAWLSGAFGDVNFTEEWTAFDSGWVTVSDNGPKAGAYTIAFDLASGNANRAFFDNIRVEVKRFVPDPEPAQIEGYQVVFWNWGVAKDDQFSVKYFKNYTAPVAEDGAIVVESLEPGKNYNDKYWMANDQGEQIDAILTNDWDTQFLIALPEPLAKGTKGKLVMKVKADKAAKAGTQCHTAIPVPGAIEGKYGYSGTYKFYSFMGDIEFTTEWKNVSVDFTVPDQGDGVQSICLNLEGLREINKYYFDDVTVYVEKEWEPKAEEGWDILTWSSGKEADDTKFSVKYFKNYVAPKSASGAIVVESLEPGKNYNDQYWMANDQGEQIDAILTNNWDTQFLIDLPKKLVAGTKVKLSMKCKADKAAGSEYQAHAAIPKAGAIEGKEGYGGSYLFYTLNTTNVSFTTDWTQVNTEFTVPDNDAINKNEGMQSICFNLEVLKEINKYYFKEIVVRVAK